ncbi:MAG: hypothetical protein L0Z63_00795 [Actinobacteria bacterium]|nr:hypothetical protein [Actinomycetota bacterium]
MQRMLSTAIAAWRNLVKRLSVDWLILTAGTLTVLLAMVLLAAGPIYANAVTESALRASLLHGDRSTTTIVVTVRTRPADHPVVDQVVNTAIEDALTGVETQIVRVVDAETLELPGQDGEGPVDLAQLRSMEGIEEHTTLVAGGWPEGAGETAVSQAAADLLDIAAGDVVTLFDRRDSREIPVEITGIYRPDDPADGFWNDDPLVTDAVTEVGRFRTHGPFIMTADALSLATPRVSATWTASPDFSTFEAETSPTGFWS